jgi:tetratricopeptide (TPR) repeat protein
MRNRIGVIPGTRAGASVAGEGPQPDRGFRLRPPGPLPEIAGVGRSAPTDAPDLAAAERHRQQAARLANAGHFSGAVDALQRALVFDPRNPTVHHALGRAYLDSGRFDEAVASFQLAIILKDDFVVAHCDLARALAGLARDREAIAACRRAVALAPELAESHRLLAELLDGIGETEQAALSLRQAAAMAAGTTPGRLDLVRALAHERNLAEAELRVREAIALDPANDELHKTLAEVLARSGRFDDAVAACDCALSLNPLQVAAHLTAVRVRKCTPADRPRLGQMAAALRHPSVTDAHRIFLHFAIGKLLDDLGQFDQAIGHFDRANKIRGRGMSFDRTGLAAHIDHLIAHFTPPFFTDHQRFGVRDETPVLIVGMPRSGTTLVEQIVSSHPAVAAGEELFFWFNRARSTRIADATSLRPEAGRSLAADYLSLLRRIAPSAARVTDKQPFNFQQLGLIHLLLPDARFIHCRRHPVDTCLSMYFTYFKGRVPFVANKADLVFAYRQYQRIMAHWRNVLPPDRFLDVDYEQLVVDREAVIRRLIAFCGLEWDDACLHPDHNRRAVNTASLWQARQPVFATSVERWRRYEPWLGELQELLVAEPAS